MIDKRETQAWRDQEADAMPGPMTPVPCSNESCEKTIELQDINGSDWLADNDPEIPFLCPECAGRVPETRKTPIEKRREINQQIMEFA